MNYLIIAICKILGSLSKTFNFGNGSTWPGHIALKLNPHFISQILANSETKIILVAGTNGKTTVSAILKSILEKADKRVMYNQSGANLVNGVASVIIKTFSFEKKIQWDFAIFEVDENTLPLILKEITPDIIVLLNLFRDQLDRYGEVRTIVANWQQALSKLDNKTTLVLNANDPQIAYLGSYTNLKSYYFGLNSKSTNANYQASDSLYCPNCNTKLVYKNIIYSHLGSFVCPTCKFKTPLIDLKTTYFPLAGTYNKFNALAASLAAKVAGMDPNSIKLGLMTFKPVFGRQEEINFKEKIVKLFLSKNPISFNQSYQTIKSLGAKNVLIVLNDRIPDGRDVSWIWDTQLFEIDKFNTLSLSGDRVYDLALRVKYEGYKDFAVYEKLEDALDKSLSKLDKNDVLYVLPTYSAMLEVRKYL